LGVDVIQILKVGFRNFRTLRAVEIPLQRQNILVGPNNVGKTSVLQGLENALGVGRRSYAFDEEDVSSGVDKTEGFEIRVTFGPASGDSFTPDETAIFGTDVDSVDGKDRLFLVVSGNAEEEGVFRTRLKFAKSDGVAYAYVAEHERRALGVLMLPAVREARREFGERGGLWARLGSDPDVSDDGRAKLGELSDELGETVVSEVLGTETATAVSGGIADLVSSVLFGNQATAEVSYAAVPLDPAQALRQIEVRLTTPDQSEGRRVGDHSVGTQSVAMFGLFGAYAQTVASQVVALGIEEPEAHLHPHAVRALVRKVLALDSQVILTTHSTAVTNAADPRSIIRLRRTPGGTVACLGATSGISETDSRWIRRVISEVGSDFLFARAVLLSEGQSEHLALPEFARQMTLDFDLLGVTVIPIHGSYFGAFAKLLGPNGLDIPFARLCDRDAASRFVSQMAKEKIVPANTDKDDLDPVRPVAIANGRFWWTAGDFEQCLMDGPGLSLFQDALVELYGANVFVNYANGSKIALPANVANAHFLHGLLGSRAISKPLVNQRVAELFGERGIAVPAEVQEVISYVAGLAAAEVAASVTPEETTPDQAGGGEATEGREEEPWI
jgi:putative ATP-dependent endonuclease of OLD family